MDNKQNLLRNLPAVDSLLHEEAIDNLLTRLPRRIVLEAVQETIASYRDAITGRTDIVNNAEVFDLSPAKLAREAAALAEKIAGMNLKSLINATGIIIHTNLGRAPLPEAAVEALNDIASRYNNLEFSLDTGKRGSRQEHIEDLICQLSGAEAAIAVNNNAAAVFLALNTIAAGREVVVSRGQLVEIGGSFRIPEIMTTSGASLREVGTTNKTYLRDYEEAVNENTAAFLKVHTSNYHMVGFTAEVGTAELAAAANKRGLLLLEDLGSGVFIDLEKYNLPPEPRVQDSIASGADLVTFSGDKMLGGPQAGIIVGRKELITAIKTNQLARTLRVDKFAVAALEATLRLYFDEERAVKEIPVWQMLTAKPEKLKKRADKMAEALGAIFDPKRVKVVKSISKVGGGALPMAELPTYLVSLELSGMDLAPDAVVEKLRFTDPPVILRIYRDNLLFDPRTIFEKQEETLVKVVGEVFQV